MMRRPQSELPGRDVQLNPALDDQSSPLILAPLFFGSVDLVLDRGLGNSLSISVLCGAPCDGHRAEPVLIRLFCFVRHLHAGGDRQVPPMSLTIQRSELRQANDVLAWMRRHGFQACGDAARLRSGIFCCLRLLHRRFFIGTSRVTATA